MSISPTDVQRSNSCSSPTLSQNPNINHGVLPASPELVGSSTSHNFNSLQISGSETTFIPNTSNSSFRSIASATTDSSGASKKVSETRTPYGRRSSYRQHDGNHSHSHSAGRGHGHGHGGISSQFRNDQVGSSQLTGELSGVASSQQQPLSGSVGIQGSVTNSAARKNNIVSANHLLNFQYDRATRPQPRRLPLPRRQQKIKPYNKDLFLQANYKFVVLDSGNYTVESTDPDKMIEWENVICVKYSTPFPVQCPICLENPLCPQITSCGHIFCFPCILRYLLMGEEDHKGDSWKKCPLCFLMISSKDLYTICIENVKHHHVGDTMEFTLLTREKSSLFPLQKNQQSVDSGVDICNTFSKFILTSDVELSVREASLELKGWLARADSGLVDDLEQLPYVCAALDHLEQRKKSWVEIQSLSCSPPLRSPYLNTPSSNRKGFKYSGKGESEAFSSQVNDTVDPEVYESTSETPDVGHEGESKLLQSSPPKKLVTEEEHVSQNGDFLKTCEGDDKKVSSAYDEGKSVQRVSNSSGHLQEKDAYSFYQAVDGQHLILHPLNMKCLLHYYGSYDLLPRRISGKILQFESVTQSEAMRRRYRYLSHLPLTTTFELCEIAISNLLPPEAITVTPFIDEIKKREYQRKRLAKKEHQEKVKAESVAMNAMPIPSNFGSSSFVDNAFSMDDFEALGSTPVPSTSPPVIGERKRFSEVTRLGFAAAHDSPSLKVDESADVSSNTGARSEASGQRNMVTLSFANIISTPKSSEAVEAPKTNGFAAKKGKKPTRVLLSTAGGRRY